MAKLRVGGIVLGLAGLLALVALAARAGRGSSGSSLHGWTVPATLVDFLFTFGLVSALVLSVLVLSRARFRVPSYGHKGFLRGLGPMLLVMGAIAFFATQTHFGLHFFHKVGNGGRAKPGANTLGGGAGTTRVVHFQWPALALAILGAVAIVAYILWRRRALPLLGAGSLAEELSQALELSLDDLRAERDARRAVIAAYARAEGVLGAHGLPRRPAETPLEYLARVLHELRVRPAAVLDLTELFERAKFSRHEIDGSMKDEAIAALAAVRDDLAAAT